MNWKAKSERNMSAATCLEFAGSHAKDSCIVLYTAALHCNHTQKPRTVCTCLCNSEQADTVQVATGHIDTASCEQCWVYRLLGTVLGKLLTQLCLCSPSSKTGTGSSPLKGCGGNCKPDRMAAYLRVYDSRHLQVDCQELGSALDHYAR